MVGGPPLDWLLERDQPAVRALTLVDLLRRPETDAEVRRARAEIPTRGWVSGILAKQLPGGFWNSNKELNRPKYLATFWMFLILRDLGVSLRVPGMRRACDLLVERAPRRDGGFSFWDESHFCVTGQIAESLIRLGSEDRGRVRDAFGWIVETQKEDGGWHCFPSREGTLDCWQGLAAFAALPRSQWSQRIKDSAEKGAEFYLHRRLHREGRTRYNPWFRFHSPTHYCYDLLVGLEVLTALGYGQDDRLGDGIRLLQKRRMTDGRRAVAESHPDVEGLVRADYVRNEPHRPVPFCLESAGRPSKIVTLRALRVLQRLVVATPAA